MIASIVMTVLLVIVVIFLHYEALRLISGAIEALSGSPRRRLLLVVGGVLTAHLLEIIVFASAYYVLPQFVQSSLLGTFDNNWVDYFYLSASSYTTLGMGDIYPEGPMRIVTAVESLVGLVLIGWTTSFTFLAMRDYWSPRTGDQNEQ